MKIFQDLKIFLDIICLLSHWGEVRLSPVHGHLVLSSHCVLLSRQQADAVIAPESNERTFRQRRVILFVP